jgi:hypothetical protein
LLGGAEGRNNVPVTKVNDIFQCCVGC